MSIKQKLHLRSKPAAIVVSIVLLVLAAAGGVFFMTGDDSEASADRATAKSPESPFSFSGVADWRKGPSNKTSMALFNNSNSCFTSVEHKSGTLDAAAELKDAQNIEISGGYTVEPGGVQTLAMQTAAGQKHYELHQSAVTALDDALELKGGQEFGYLQLSDGYLEIEGYCDTPGELPTTIPALEAIKFSGA